MSSARTGGLRDDHFHRGAIDIPDDNATPRTITADLFISLDGYARGKRSPAYFGMLGPQLEAWIARELDASQTLVMGRVTYETLERYDDGSSPLPAMPKLVVSRTLESASWGDTTIVDSDHALEALKAQPGPPMRVIGSISLVQRLLGAGALDRLRLVIFPLVLGESGDERLFEQLPDLSLELASSEVLDDRLLLLEYRRPATG
jgi:dihydrofolate reductase